MDGILILEQYTILIRIASFLRNFKNVRSKSTPPPVSPTLLGTAMSTSSYFYYRVTTYLDSIMCFTFQTSSLTLYLALLTKEIK